MSESLKIDINSGTKSVLKLGLVLRASAILFTLACAAFAGIEFLRHSLTVSFICFVLAFGLFIVFFKILSAAFFKEYIVVTKNTLTVFQKNTSGLKKFPIEISDILFFGSIVDFTGLATGERELQYIIDEGNIKIETENEIIRFGKNVPSWDVEEIVEEIESFTGKKFVSPNQEPPIESPFVDEKPEIDIFAKVAEGIELDTPEETSEENEELSDPEAIKHVYHCPEGELTIIQEEDEPDADDKAFLNGQPAPTGKYQIGEKKFVFVSNGVVYAVRA